MRSIFLILAFAVSTFATKAQDYPEMIQVEGGTFMMGNTDNKEPDNKKPAHAVTLKTFYIAKTETTVKQWKIFCDATKRDFSRNVKLEDGEDMPMAFVSWDDAVAYTDWLSKKTGKTYRLPTEAEWEFAARGGNKSKGYQYSGGNNIEDVGWCEILSSELFSAPIAYGIHKVASKKANELGIYDMSGNLMEWCNDWYSEDYYTKSSKSNPKGASKGTERVLRGGSGYDDAEDCLVYSRYHEYPSALWSVRVIDIGNFGFRVVYSD